MKPALYKIESGIPLPQVGQDQKSEIRLLLESLKVGQSVLVQRTDIQPEAIYYIAKLNGTKFATRLVNCNGRRIWRVK